MREIRTHGSTRGHWRRGREATAPVPHSTQDRPGNIDADQVGTGRCAQHPEKDVSPAVGIGGTDQVAAIRGKRDPPPIFGEARGEACAVALGTPVVGHAGQGGGWPAQVTKQHILTRVGITSAAQEVGCSCGIGDDLPIAREYRVLTGAVCLSRPLDAHSGRSPGVGGMVRDLTDVDVLLPVRVSRRRVQVGRSGRKDDRVPIE